MHAWSVRDTTSSIYGKEKVALMKMAKKSENAQSALEVMCNYWATKKEIREVSIKIFIEMYSDTKDYFL